VESGGNAGFLPLIIAVKARKGFGTGKKIPRTWRFYFTRLSRLSAPMRVVLKYNTINSNKQFLYLSVAEVARATSLTIDSIYKHIRAGHLVASKPTNFDQYMVEPAELSAFLQARAKGRFVRPPKRQAVAKEVK
jgi:hypothetical protein